MISLMQKEFERFMAADDGKPVVMLNLLRFQRDGGRERYFKYIEMVTPLVQRYGAQVQFVGDGLEAIAAEAGQAWDMVALVRYPTRKAFADMVKDPEYAKAGAMRESSLVEAVLQPTRPL